MKIILHNLFLLSCPTSPFLSLWEMTDLWLKWMCNSTPTRVLALVTPKPEVMCVYACVSHQRQGKELAEMRTRERECESEWMRGKREMSLPSFLLGPSPSAPDLIKEKKRKKKNTQTWPRCYLPLLHVIWAWFMKWHPFWCISTDWHKHLYYCQQPYHPVAQDRLHTEAKQGWAWSVRKRVGV